MAEAVWAVGSCSTSSWRSVFWVNRSFRRGVEGYRELEGSQRANQLPEALALVSSVSPFLRWKNKGFRSQEGWTVVLAERGLWARPQVPKRGGAGGLNSWVPKVKGFRA